MVPSTNKKHEPTSTRDPEATKARILEAAEVEFASTGLLGARMEAIASNTGVTKAMLHYYFKDKEGLYIAVLENILSERMRLLRSADLHHPDCMVALEQFLEALLLTSARSENMAAIFLFEALQNKGKFYGKMAIATLYEPLVELLKRGMAQGQFRQMDPMHGAVNIVGMCVFYYCSQHNVRHLWPPDVNIMSDEMKNAHNRQAIEMVKSAVRA